MTAPTDLALSDIVTVKGDSTPNYRATVEIINGDRITVRPLADQNMTTRARAVNRATILDVVKKANPRTQETITGGYRPQADDEPAAPPARVRNQPSSVQPPIAPKALAPADDLAGLRADVSRYLATNFPEATQAWRNGWRAACTHILKQIDKRAEGRNLPAASNDSAPKHTTLAAE